MTYRLDKNQLLDILGQWNHFLKRKVHLIACGGTAMTLLGVKPSTKDVDFMVPDTKEHAYLTKQLQKLGYRLSTAVGWEKRGEPFRFDLFRGNNIHTTGLMHSPLEEGRNHTLIEFSHLYIGILNDYDLTASKLMRGTRVDFEDCLALAVAHREQLDIGRLVAHFHEMVGYDVAEERLRPHMERFLEQLRESRHHD